jgi:hypothetical protein
MSTDIDSLTPEHCGHVVSLGIGRKGLRKTLLKDAILRPLSLDTTAVPLGTADQLSPPSFRSSKH